VHFSQWPITTALYWTGNISTMATHTELPVPVRRKHHVSGDVALLGSIAPISYGTILQSHGM